MKLSRRQYADLYGPTACDRIRLADTDLLIEITRDLTVPGEDKRVTLVSIGGNRVAYGINVLVNGRLDYPNVKAKAFAAAREQGFLGKVKV